jgi:hypothetical protein
MNSVRFSVYPPRNPCSEGLKINYAHGFAGIYFLGGLASAGSLHLFGMVIYFGLEGDPINILLLPATILAALGAFLIWDTRRRVKIRKHFVENAVLVHCRMWKIQRKFNFMKSMPDLLFHLSYVINGEEIYIQRKLNRRQRALQMPEGSSFWAFYDRRTRELFFPAEMDIIALPRDADSQADKIC